MISFGVKSDLDKLSKSFTEMGNKQVPFATALALTRTAQQAKETLYSAMRREFDRPTPFTLNSLYVKPATKTDLSAMVGHKQLQGRGVPVSIYLRPEIEGGNRPQKSTEKLLGHYVMPSSYVVLDQYGNIPGGLLRSIRDAVEGGNATLANGKTYIVIPEGNPRGMKPGVYLRTQDKVSIRGKAGAKTATQHGGKFLPILFFSKAPHYSVRYDFEGTVDRLVNAEFGRNFSAAMDYALSTARVKV